MFPPYPYFPSSSSSSYPSSFTSFLNPENASSNNNNNNNTFFHDPLSVPYTVPTTTTTTTTTHHHAPPIPETLTNWTVADHYAALLKQDLTSGGGFHHYGSSISNLLTKKPAKKPAKKDRHSKIHTSQGLRDRRVRLSIEIARKFFDLQDMLGFDKASNTLEWLFNKSKIAIEELTLSKQNSSSAAADDHSFSYSSSEADEVYSKDITDTNINPADSEERKFKRAQQVENSKMKESREKARARARERTSGKVQDLKEKEKYPATENLQIFHQLMPDHEDSTANHIVGGELQRDDIFNFIEESIVIKRKLKKSSVSSSHHHQNNTLIPKEASYDNSDCHSSPMSSNWDANNAAANICTISSMNLSAGLQIFGKSWEECNSSPHRY